jgi:hypothetical protein
MPHRVRTSILFAFLGALAACAAIAVSGGAQSAGGGAHTPGNVAAQMRLHER